MNAERPRLPMVKMEKDYVFEGPGGKQGPADLFAGRRQLIVYHFMFGPEADKGCPKSGCVLRYEQTFMRPLLPQTPAPAP